jgi:mRNA interferase MazF
MAMVVNYPKRGEVYLVCLDPTVGAEMQKTRPCVIVSPNEMNKYIKTIIIAPMTTAQKEYPTRGKTDFDGKIGQIVLDQIRTVDKNRLVKKLGTLSDEVNEQMLNTLVEMFSPN